MAICMMNDEATKYEMNLESIGNYQINIRNLCSICTILASVQAWGNRQMFEQILIIDRKLQRPPFVLLCFHCIQSCMHLPNPNISD